MIERLIVIDLPAAREILVVNDGSTDGTRDVLDRILARPEIRIIHADKNGGKGSAIRIGFARATGTIVAIQDADLELDPAQIAELVQPILDGRTRVVYGSRFLAGRPAAPWLSIFANRVLTGVTNLLFGGRITDMETCYKVMEREVAQSLKLESNRFDIEPEITAKLLRAGHSISNCRSASSSQPRARQEDWLARRRARRPGAGQEPLFKMTRQHGAIATADRRDHRDRVGGIRRRARNLGSRWIRFLLLCVDGEGICRRRAATSQCPGGRCAVA